MLDKDLVKMTLISQFSNRGDLGKVDVDFTKFVKAGKSASNIGAYFQAVVKSINEATGEAMLEIMTDSDNLRNVQEAVERVRGEIGSLGRDYTYAGATFNVSKMQGSLKLVGESARKEAFSKVKERGGYIEKSLDDEDLYNFVVPYAGEELDSIQNEISKLENVAPRTKKGKIRKNSKEYHQIQALQEKAHSSVFGKAEELSLKAENERDLADFTRQSKEKEKENEKKNVESNAKRMAILGVIVSLVTIATDILRRILSATLERAGKTITESRTGHTLGLSTKDVQRYNIFDIKHGMKEGTTIGGLQDIQSAFGNIDYLDEEAIKILAPVMGTNVKETVKSSLKGGATPKELQDMILNSFFQRFLEGKGSISGDVIGQEPARRELYSKLSRFSSDIAEKFITMTEEYTAGANKGKFRNVSEWENVFMPTRQLSDSAVNYNKEIGQRYNEISGLIRELKDKFLILVGNKLEGILTFISNIRLGMSETEKRELDRKNRELNKKELASIQTRKEATIAMSTEDYNKEIDKLKVKGLISDDFSLDLDALAKVYQGDTSGLTRKQKKDAERVINQIALGKGELTHGFFTYMALREEEKEVKKGVNAEIGSDIPRYTATADEIRFKAEQMQIEALDRTDLGLYINMSESGRSLVRDAYLQYLQDEPEYLEKAKTFAIYNLPDTQEKRKAWVEHYYNAIKEERGLTDGSSKEELARAKKEAERLADIEVTEEFWQRTHAPAGSPILQAELEKRAYAMSKESLVQMVIKSLERGGRLASGTYHVKEGYAGSSGEYTLKIDVKTDKGTVSKTVVLTDTDAPSVKDLGSFVVDERGKVYTNATTE